ncbi:hypothetical protein FB451DRAFT_1297185 [Mycena latifolia]|nr:hypothetical protein FB451DRAFT_1297185 [Mycena latifolia]
MQLGYCVVSLFFGVSTLESLARCRADIGEQHYLKQVPAGLLRGRRHRWILGESSGREYACSATRLVDAGPNN